MTAPSPGLGRLLACCQMMTALCWQVYGLELDQSQRELLFREMTTVYQICARPSHRLVVSWAVQGPGR